MTIVDLEKKVLEMKSNIDINMREVEELLLRISNLKNSENKQPEKWKPGKGEFYNCILSDGSIGSYMNVNDSIDEDRIKASSSFPKDMPLDDVVMMHQFINEMELICWQLGIQKPASLDNYAIQSKGRKICYRFGSMLDRDKAESMLSDKVKDWLEIT